MLLTQNTFISRSKEVYHLRKNHDKASFVVSKNILLSLQSPNTYEAFCKNFNRLLNFIV